VPKHSFPETGKRHDHTVVVCDYGFCRLALGSGQFAEERYFDRFASVSQVFQLEAAFVFLEQHPHVVQTPSRQTDVLSAVLGSDSIDTVLTGFTGYVLQDNIRSVQSSLTPLICDPIDLASVLPQATVMSSERYTS
jgi:hypothetical protein